MTSTSTLLLAALFAVLALAGILGLRPLSRGIRIAFDAACFAAIGLFLLKRGISPLFPPLSDSPTAEAVWLRVISGAWWLLGARLAVAAHWFIFHRDKRSREARLFFDLTAAAVYMATALVILNSVLALPVTGILATSGVMAIVLGLALQNTLADVFAGVVVGIESPFSIGDRIKLNDTIEGEVVLVNWRSIRLQTDDDVAIIPNSLVAKAQIVNRSYPSPRRSDSIELTCPVQSDPERVIDSLLHATLLCPRILREPPPSAVLVRLGASRNAYLTSYHVDDTQYLAATRDTLLRQARRQLFYAGLLPGSQPRTLAATALAVGAVADPVRRLLRDVVLFDCLDDGQVDGLATQAELRMLEPGEVLFAQDAADNCLYVIATGVLELSRRGEVKAQNEILGCVGAGEYVGEIGLLTGSPRAATATACTHCRVYQLSRHAIVPLLAKNPEVAAAFEKSVRRGLQMLHREVPARATEHIGAAGQLLLQIRGLFHSQAS